MSTGAWRPDSDLSFLTTPAWDRAESLQESILFQASCFQPGLRWVPDVSLSSCCNGRAPRYGLMDTWFPFVHPVSGAYQGGLCSRRQGFGLLLPPPRLLAGSLVLFGVQLELGDGFNYYTKSSLSQGPGQDGAEKERPAPSFLWSQEGPLLSNTRNRKGASSAHGCVCSLLLCLNPNRTLSESPTRRANVLVAE